MTKLRITKKAHAALLRVIPFLLANPERYHFMRSAIPSTHSTRERCVRGCLLAWVGHFMGVKDQPGVQQLEDIAQALGFASEWRFYLWLDARHDREFGPASNSTAWQDRAEIAVRYLRILARRVPA